MLSVSVHHSSFRGVDDPAKAVSALSMSLLKGIKKVVDPKLIILNPDPDPILQRILDPNP
jgi:hypothetical protein